MQTWLNLQDKIIIVTGGACGIGLAIVEELLAQGANVQMVDIHGGDGQYEGHKGYQFWPTDISSAKEVNHTVAEIIQRFGRIDGLVNNAGVNFPRLLVDEKAPAGQYELNEAAFEKMVNINQKGVFLMSQAVARQMVKQHDGVIVNVSSESGLEGSEGQSCYAATKAALNSFTRSGRKSWVNTASVWSVSRPGFWKKPGYARRNMKRRWRGRAISPSSSCVKAIPKTPFLLGAPED